MEEIITPVDPEKLKLMLDEANYDKKETEFLYEGFKYGFPLGYKGPQLRQTKANNLKLRVGDHIDLWNKVMKEVENKRYSGPWENPPFDNYIQSPIGLVPKQEPGQTRLITHLSHPVGDSVNSHIDKEDSAVSYMSFDDAVRLAQQQCELAKVLDEGNENKGVYLAKSDLKSAFRILPSRKQDWPWLVIKAMNPLDRKDYYFFDKAVTFGSSSSCKNFQRFSNGLAAIFKHKMDLQAEANPELKQHVMLLKAKGVKESQIKTQVINYLDDFLFGKFKQSFCDLQVTLFIEICAEINFPVSLEKTEWASPIIVFLGLLINTITRTIAIPQDKVNKAVDLIEEILSSKKVKVIQIQSIAGTLNFMCKAIVPGRAFVRRLYYKIAGLKQHHHVRVGTEIKEDLNMWLSLLKMGQTVCRPFMDFSKVLMADELYFYTDASLAADKGIGGVFKSSYFFGQYPEGFIQNSNPSIEFCELLAVAVGIQLYGGLLQNRRVIIFCDNQSVVEMINQSSTKSPSCMQLIRHITFLTIQWNNRFFCRHVAGLKNREADLLSRMKIGKFKREAKLNNRRIDPNPTPLPDQLWPVPKTWFQ